MRSFWLSVISNKLFDNSILLNSYLILPNFNPDNEIISLALDKLRFIRFENKFKIINFISIYYINSLNE